MKCHIEISMDNAAFDDAPATELSRIIETAAEHARNGELSQIPLTDINGNSVGYFMIVD